MQKLLVNVIISFTLLSAQVQAPLMTNNDTNVSVTDATDLTAEQSIKQKANNVVKQWVSEISKHEEFCAFSDATWEISALGPGTHSYLVIFNKNEDDIDNSIGYLILHIAETGGLYIGEYGKGHFEGLISYAEKRPLQTVYVHPFEAITIDEQQQAYELYTNENYPINLQLITQHQNIKPSLNADTQLIQSSVFNYALTLPYFSPYDSLIWLSSEPINDQLIDDRSIETEIEFEQQLYYRTKNWDKKISTVFAVTALHKWNDNLLYIGLQLDDENSIRYISYAQLLDLGLFYSS